MMLLRSRYGCMPRDWQLGFMNFVPCPSLSLHTLSIVSEESEHLTIQSWQFYAPDEKMSGAT